MKVLPNLKGVTIGKFAKQNIAEFSKIETNNYRSLRKPLADKYFHSYETFAPYKDMLKWLHTIISNAKAFIEGTYHSMERKHIQLYLDEFCYRFNRPDVLFMKICLNAWLLLVSTALSAGLRSC